MATTAQSWLPQFSLRSFLIAIAILGIGLAAVLSASETSALALAIVFNLLLPTAVVLALVLSGTSRGFWIGVAVFGVSCSLFFAEKAGILDNRAAREVGPLLHDYVSTPIAELHQARIERDADRMADRESVRLASRMTREAAVVRLAGRRAAYLENARARVQQLATVSARRFLMILLALSGGCLGNWASRYRLYRGSSTTGTGGDGG